MDENFALLSIFIGENKDERLRVADVSVAALVEYKGLRRFKRVLLFS